MFYDPNTEHDGTRYSCKLGYSLLKYSYYNLVNCYLSNLRINIKINTFATVSCDAIFETASAIINSLPSATCGNRLKRRSNYNK